MRMPRPSRVLSGRDRRAVRIGMLLTAPVLLNALVIKPYVATVRRLWDATQAQSALVDREEDLAASAAVIGSSSKRALETARRTRSRTYLASDTLLSATTFGRDVTQALEQAGLAIQRVETRDSLGWHTGLRELVVDVRAQGDFEAILSALARLEAHTHLFHVSRLSIDRLPESSALGQSLSLTAEVHGYAQ